MTPLLHRLGVVVAVVSNERLSSAVSEARASVQNNVQDLDTFLRNTKMQLRFLVSNSLEQTVDAIYSDLDGRVWEPYGGESDERIVALGVIPMR